jgi:hypothetical protein
MCPRRIRTVLGIAALTAASTTGTQTNAAPQFQTREIVPETRNGLPLVKAAYYGVVPADYDGDGRADLSLKLDSGTWKIDYAANGFGSWDRIVPSRGGPTAVPVPADYDRDGRADLAVRHDSGLWQIDFANNGFGFWQVEVVLPGGRDAIPVPADYDGDGRADLAQKDRDGTWWIDFAADGFGAWNAAYAGYGGATDPAPADYDGDGRTDIATKDVLGRWRIDYAANGFGSFNATYSGFGGHIAHAVPADYDGDRRADLAIKEDGGRWRIDYSSNGFGLIDATNDVAGGITARAVAADYDGDGRADLSVRVDCGEWINDYASNGFGRWERRVDYADVNAVKTVTSGWDLVATLYSDFTGTIQIPSGAAIDLSGHPENPIRSCVQIKSTRRGLDQGGIIFTDSIPGGNGEEQAYALFDVRGHDVRLEGFRFRGPSEGERSSSLGRVSGIRITQNAAVGLGVNVVVENVNAWFWTKEAIAVNGQVYATTVEAVPPDTPRMSANQAGLTRVSRNFIHHNSRDGLGYGVSVNSGGYATIEGNLFDHNRHAIASNGAPYTAYFAHYNYVLDGGYTQSGSWNQHFDVHGSDGGYGGVAGELFDISFNTFRGDQDYFVNTRAAFWLRGTPTVGAFFHDNVLLHSNRGEAVRLKSPDCWIAYPVGGGEYSDELCHLVVGPNTYGTDTSGGLAVGDFDGDGRDDVFLANGTGWWYSSAGLTEWRFLRASSLMVGSLRFGRFDTDLKTDVLFTDGPQWFVSSGGTGTPVVRAAYDGLPLSSSVFGDFDGNGLTDLLHIFGTQWYLSPGLAGSWSLVHEAAVAASALRVGDFDGDGRDDIFLVANSRWSWWKPGWTTFLTLNPSISVSVGSLAIGDFDGDGRDDIVQTSGDGWRYSRSGSLPWATLRGPGGQPQYRDVRAAVIGHFTPYMNVVALRYETTQIGGLPPVTRDRFAAWWNQASDDAFFRWSDEYVR